MSNGYKSPGEPPPTANEMLDKIRQQFKRFKGGPVLLFAALLTVAASWTAWFTVQPEETGIVQRFGKAMRTALPGLHFKLPLGVEKIRYATGSAYKDESQPPAQEKP